MPISSIIKLHCQGREKESIFFCFVLNQFLCSVSPPDSWRLNMPNAVEFRGGVIDGNMNKAVINRQDRTGALQRKSGLPEVTFSCDMGEVLGYLWFLRGQC